MINRFSVALSHLALSMAVILGTVGLLVWHFYPGAFSAIEDIASLLGIIIPVDIVIGPLLTLIVFKQGKPGLKFDLVVIGICQTLALAYGCWTAYDTRPGYLIFSYDTFYVAPPDIDQTPLANSGRQDLMVGKLGQPRVVHADFDLPFAEQMQLAQESMSSGKPMILNSRFFRPIETLDSEKLLKRSIKPALLQKRANPPEQEILDTLLQNGRRMAFIPLINDDVIRVIAIDADSKDILEVLDIFPL